jgi:hypothetical protein
MLRLVSRVLAFTLRPLGTLSLEILFVRDLTVSVPEVSASIEITIRTADEADLDWIAGMYRDDPYLYIGDEHVDEAAADSDSKADVEAYRRRLRRGEKCFLAFAGQQIVHVNWLCFSWAEEAVCGRSFKLEPGEAYTTDAYTVIAFRGKNVHAVVLGAMLDAAKAAGSRKVYTVTSIDRPASFSAFRQLGWRVQGKVLCFVAKKGTKTRLIRLSGNIDPLLRRGGAEGPTP